MGAMGAIKSLAGVYMIVVGAAVAVHFIVTQFYDPALTDTALTEWRIMDPLMVAATAMAFAAATCCKLQAGSGQGEPVTRGYLEAQVGFYVSGVMLIALLWNWIGVEFVEPRNDDGLLWIIIDSTLPFLLCTAGIRLFRDAKS